MNRKTMGLRIVVAVFSLSAIVASSASAQLTSNKPHTVVIGTQENSHKFTAGNGLGSITCSTATFSGTGVGKHWESGGNTGYEEATQGITPTFSGCKDSFGRAVHVVENTLTLTVLSGANKGKLDIDGSAVMTVTGSLHCTITIGTQTAVNGVSFHNLGGTSGVRTTISSTNVKTSISGGFFACGSSATSSETGTYEGITVMTGSGTDGTAAEISVD